MLWQNAPSVILGQNQNAFSEVNIPYAEEHKIKIARRITGGGAVYHDLNNINFSFIVNEDSSEIDFKRFLEPVVKVLNELGVSAVINGRNDIEANGLKISGNAQCHKYGKILHHGTLLYSFDSEILTSVLNVDEEKIKSKGIKSVKARVGRIKDFTDVSIDGLMSRIISAFSSDEWNLSENEIKEIEKLRDEKFSSWDFIFGVSKSYEKKAKKRFEGGTVEIEYNCDRGIINEVHVSGDFFMIGELGMIEEAVKGCKMIKDEIKNAIIKSGCTIYGVSSEELSDLFFE
jgi:lipoate-protein ligase A